MKKRKIPLFLIALGLLVLLGLFFRPDAPVDYSPAPVLTEAPASAPAALPEPELSPDQLQIGEETPSPQPEENAAPMDEDGSYDGKEDVALYLHTYGHLPGNYVSKKTARAAGWSGGSVEPYYPGCCIGGDTYGNYEGLLPKAKGRTWQECDINTLGRDSRGPERIVWSSDGLIYYTPDHYESWELLYGEP